MATLSNLKYYVVVLVLLSCRSHEIVVDSNKIFQAPQLSDSLAFYFPKALDHKANRPKYDNFLQNWFSSSLYSLKEPILKDKTSSETLYRFLWLRSFHLPVCYSIKVFNNELYLNTKTLDRSPEWFETIREDIIHDTTVLDTIKADRLAYIKFNETIKIDEAEWNQFESLLMKSKFWNLSSIDDSDGSTDGSEWILEGYKNKKYHFVVRHNPHELRECGMFLISLSNLKIPQDEIY